MPPKKVAALAAVTMAMAGAAPSPASPSLSFDKVFAAPGEPARIHYRVAYRAGGAVHRLEVWRDGQRRIVRITDGRISSYASRRPGADGYRLTVLDVPRRLRTDVDRTNLYRIGSFIDWFDLGHGLRHPRGRYTLVTLAKAPPVAAPLRPCDWYGLTEGGRRTSICWDAHDHVPMLIAAEGGALMWRMLALDTRPIDPKRFAIDDAGFVKVDANQDISSD